MSGGRRGSEDLTFVEFVPVQPLGAGYAPKYMRRLLAGASLAGGVGTCACVYANRLAKYESQRREDKEVEGHLMAVQDAQRTRVIRLPRLLDDNEIQLLHEVHAAHESHLGQRVKPASSQASSYKTGQFIDNALPEEGVRVSYLNTAGVFERALPALRSKLIAAAFEADARHWHVLGGATHDVVPRCAEYHVSNPPGGLPYPDHFDEGSLLTIDVMLSENGAFDGGQFCTLEADGTLTAHPFQKGDALVWVSHKPHCVEPLTRGQRRVLVMELWEGRERHCGHRCETHWGACYHPGWEG